jgi:hypothetical protein
MLRMRGSHAGLVDPAGPVLEERLAQLGVGHPAIVPGCAGRREAGAIRLPIASDDSSLNRENAPRWPADAR